MLSRVPDWVFLYAGTAAVLTAAALCVALAVRRAFRTDPRCPRCGYDLAGLTVDAPPWTCPECGRAIASPRHLRRLRRFRTVLAVASALALAGLALRATPALRARGPYAVVPTWLLLEIATPTSTRAVHELNYRTPSSDAQWAKWLRLVGDVRTPPAWPVDQPMPIEYRDTKVMDTDTNEWRRVAVRVLDPSQPGWLIRDPESRFSSEQLWVRDGHQRLVTSPLDDRAVTVEIVSDGHRRTLRFPVPLGPPAGQRLQQVSGPDADRSVTWAFRRSLLADAVTGRAVLLLNLGGPQYLHQLLAGVTFGLRIEFRHHDRAVAHAATWFTWADAYRGYGHIPLHGDGDAVLSADPGDPSWTVRITGDPDIAARKLDATSYWAGTIDLPLSHLREPAPPRHDAPLER